EQLLPGGGVANGRQPGQRRAVPTPIRSGSQDCGQVLRAARVVEGCQYQGRFRRVRGVGQVLGGQRVPIGQFVPRQQARQAQLKRQVGLRLEQGSRFTGRCRRIQRFQRRQRICPELVVVPTQPARQHGDGPVVAQAAQRPGNLLAVAGIQQGLAGGGQEE